MTKKNIYKVAALYRFVPLEDISTLRREIYSVTKNYESICGTLLLAPEGINGTIAGFEQELDSLIAFLSSKLEIEKGELKYSTADKKPFNRFKVRPKKELITLRQPQADPNKLVGEYVEAKDWNALINDPEVTVIDTRNDYETKVGIFDGAIDPNMKIFTDFPGWVKNNLDPAKHKKVAMFCTGGIRCEKASSYMMAEGFENIYHLKGGILKYLEDIPQEDSKWKGECFVFDQRVSVGHGLKQGEWVVCHACREPLSAADIQHPDYEKGISCHHCKGTLTQERENSLRARQKHYAELYDEAG